MSIVRTDLRETIEAARRIRFEPTSPLTATNVQNAIEQARSLPPAIPSTTAVNFAMSPYAPLSADTMLLVDTTGGAITINLAAQASRAGLPLGVKDATGHALTNPISLVANGAETIDGLATYPLDSNYATVQLNPEAGGYFIAP